LQKRFLALAGDAVNPQPTIAAAFRWAGPLATPRPRIANRPDLDKVNQESDIAGRKELAAGLPRLNAMVEKQGRESCSG
jgi:hypothetical protein